MDRDRAMAVPSNVALEAVCAHLGHHGRVEGSEALTGALRVFQAVLVARMTSFCLVL
jgi:hypothetical protein